MSRENEPPPQASASPQPPPPPAAPPPPAEKEAPEKRPPDKPAARAAADAEKMSLSMKLFVVLFYAVIGLVVAWYAGGWPFMLKNWLYFVAGFAALLVTASLVSTRRWFAKAKAQQRMGAVILFAVVAIIAFFVVVFMIEPDYQAAVLRLIFITIVCSLPAVMYYLFIATKKNSLLNELTINLSRLGLLNPERMPPELRLAGLGEETEPAKENRIKTYVQKFESVYGTVPTDHSGFLIRPTDPAQSTGGRRASAKGDAAGGVNFSFDTVLPVLLATLLIALGWLITLPPWEGKLEFWKRGGPALAVIEAQSNKVAPVASGDRAAPATDPAAAKSATASSATATDKWVAVFSPVKSPVRFAFVGAYFFALQLLFRRYVRRDLRASAYVAVSLRVILAVLGVWVLTAALELMPAGTVGAKDSETFANTLLISAFVVGVFPRVLWQVLQAGLKKRLGWLLAPNLQTQLPISDLDGLTVWHEARFEEEDIENIPNMATADIVDLLINTRFPPDRVIDWVDQAILYTHLGHEEKRKGEGPTRRELLRAHGIRTASALVEVYNRSEAHGDRAEFEQVLSGDGRRRVRSLVDAVGSNPNLKLIQTWRGLSPHKHDDAAPRDGSRRPAAEPRGREGGDARDAEVTFPAELHAGDSK